MSRVEIYHNPRCSKSRQTLELIKAQGIDPTITQYLKNVPTSDQLKAILKALKMEAHQLLRSKEAEYKTHNLSKESSQEDIISAMLASPNLIERPIVINNNCARIGRPPESVLDIL